MTTTDVSESNGYGFSEGKGISIDSRTISNERGSLLIAGLWAMTFFSILGISLIFNASQHTVMMKKELESLGDKTDLMSGFNQAAARIASDPYAHEDSKEDLWYGSFVLEKPFEGMVVQMEDEESKINLNYVTQRFLDAFLKKFEEEVMPLQSDRKDLIKSLLKYRSKKRIASLEELLLMEDFSREDYQILEPYLTVYPEAAQININTASSLVLETLVESIPSDHAAKQMLISRLSEYLSFPHGFRRESGSPTKDFGDDKGFLSKDLNPEVFIQKLKLPQTPFMQSLVQEFVAAITTDSENFRISIKTKTGKTAESSFRYRVGQLRPEIFFWNEAL